MIGTQLGVRLCRAIMLARVKWGEGGRFGGAGIAQYEYVFKFPNFLLLNILQ